MCVSILVQEYICIAIMDDLNVTFDLLYMYMFYFFSPIFNMFHCFRWTSLLDVLFGYIIS